MMQKYFLPLLFSCVAFAVNAQTEHSALTHQILQLDSAVFEAFNRCDLSAFRNYFDEHLEFYHDKDGLTDYENTLQALKKNCDNKLMLSRSLEPGTEVYPLGTYGAVQLGKHRFCHPEDGTEDCGTFAFVHIWKNVNGQWKITRVISYGH
jgi:hypothetical protein